MKRAAWGFAAVWLLVPLACAGQALDERVAATPGGTLEVDLDLGDGLRPDPGLLEVTSHDRDEVRVRARVSGWGGSGVKFALDREEGRVRLVGGVEGAFSWLFGGPRIEVRVWVPREFSLDLRMSAGPVRVDDVRGKVWVRTGDGSVDVSNTAGPHKLRTTDGDVTVNDASGEIRVRVSVGDIDLRWVNGTIDARTEEGAIEASHVRGPVTARSDRGEIELDGVSGAVDARTEQGSIYAHFSDGAQGVLETRSGSLEVLIPQLAGVRLNALSRDGEVELSEDLGVEGPRTASRFDVAIRGGGESLRLYTARGHILVGSR